MNDKKFIPKVEQLQQVSMELDDGEEHLSKKKAMASKKPTKLGYQSSDEGEEFK